MVVILLVTTSILFPLCYILLWFLNYYCFYIHLVQVKYRNYSSARHTTQGTVELQVGYSARIQIEVI